MRPPKQNPYLENVRNPFDSVEVESAKKRWEFEQYPEPMRDAFMQTLVYGSIILLILFSMWFTISSTGNSVDPMAGSSTKYINR